MIQEPEFYPVMEIQRLAAVKAQKIRLRNNIKTTKNLKSSFNEGYQRYDYHELRGIVEYRLACSLRKYRGVFRDYTIQKYTYNHNGYHHTQNIRDDFWMEFQTEICRVPIRNDQVNILYIGSDIKYLSKRLGRSPTLYELAIQKIWYEEFKHLCFNKAKDRIRVSIWW